MTLAQLQCFLEVARVRHFGRAAERIGTTQPSLSLQIQKLESELGVTLLNREGGRVALTGAGEILLPRAREILAETSVAKVRIDEIRGKSGGRLRIGVLPTVAAHFLPPVLVRFRAQAANVEVVLREERTTEELLRLLLEGEVDVGIGLKPPITTGVKVVPLLTEEICLAVSNKHPLASRRHVPMKALEGEKLIVYKMQASHTRERILEACHNAGIEPSIAFESEQVETIQYLVAANLGVTILPEMVLRRSTAKGIALVRVQDSALRRTIAALRAADSYFPRPQRQLIRVAQEVGRVWHAQV